MAPKHAAKGQEDALNKESEVTLHESKRLQDLAYKGMLSETRRMCTEETVPSKVLLKADGKDITKKSTLRKGRYLLNINAQMAAAAEGRMGALSQLDTKNPVLYIDFPEGRLKFRGTLMFPANKYMILKFGTRDILCEDVLDCMVVFSEAYWIGTKDENPEEHKMPMPLSVIEAGKKGQEAADTGVAQSTQATANGSADPVMRAPGSQRKRRAGADQDDSSSGGDDEDVEGGTPAVGRRMSQRSAAKRVKYNVDDSDDDAPSADEDDANDRGVQKLRRQRPAQPAAARRLALQSSQEGASQQEAEPGSRSGPEPAAGRTKSTAAAGNGHLQTVPEEEAEEADQPVMTQRSTRPCSQQAKDVSKSGGRPAAQPPKRRKLAKIETDDEDEDEVIDLSSQPSPIRASQSARPRRNAAGVKLSLKEASSEDESEEAIEGDGSDEDFLA